MQKHLAAVMQDLQRTKEPQASLEKKLTTLFQKHGRAENKTGRLAVTCCT